MFAFLHWQTQDPNHHNHNFQAQYQASIFQHSMDHGINQANKFSNHPIPKPYQKQHCCHADGKLVDIDGLSTQCRTKGEASVVHIEENETSSDEGNLLQQDELPNTTGNRLIDNAPPDNFANARVSSARFSMNNSTSNKIGIAAKFCRPRPKSMDAEVLKNLQRNCHNLMLEGKRDKNRSLSDNEDTSTDGEDSTTLEESSDIFKEKDIDQLMEEQRQISGNKCQC